MSTNQVRNVEQEGVDDCLPACIAAVTGHSIDRVKAAVSVPTPHIEALAYLSRNGILFYQLPIVEDMPVSAVLADSSLWCDKCNPNQERTAILTIESPRNDIEWHAVVYDKGEIFDPMGYWDSLEEIQQRACTFAIEVHP